MPQVITEAEACRSFFQILDQVYYQHQRFDIKRDGEIIARLAPVKQPLFTVGEFQVVHQLAP